MGFGREVKKKKKRTRVFKYSKQNTSSVKLSRSMEGDSNGGLNLDTSRGYLPMSGTSVTTRGGVLAREVAKQPEMQRTASHKKKIFFFKKTPNYQ